jgi:hypothetical protein
MRELSLPRTRSTITLIYLLVERPLNSPYRSLSLSLNPNLSLHREHLKPLEELRKCQMGRLICLSRRAVYRNPLPLRQSTSLRQQAQRNPMLPRPLKPSQLLLQQPSPSLLHRLDQQKALAMTTHRHHAKDEYLVLGAHWTAMMTTMMTAVMTASPWVPPLVHNLLVEVGTNS